MLGCTLMHMYAKCGALCQMQSILERLPFCDVVSWTTFIAGYARNRQCQQVVDYISNKLNMTASI